MANLVTRGLGSSGNIVSFGLGGFVFEIEFPLGITLEIDSEILRVIDVDSGLCRDFLIIARADDGTNLLGYELSSEVHKDLNLNTQVVRSIDIESIIEIAVDEI